MVSYTEENYLKAIVKLLEKNLEEISTTAIAESLAVKGMPFTKESGRWIKWAFGFSVTFGESYPVRASTLNFRIWKMARP